MSDTPILHIATDHAGLDLSHHFIEHFRGLGYEVHDHGPSSYDPVDDYPAFCIAAAEAVAQDAREGRFALGIVIGGSGNGEQIAANKVVGIRAALVWSHDTAVLARQHNDANVVAVGARQHSVDEATALVEAFVREPFSGDERHVRRIGQIAEYERTRG
ncbi:ribose-5-phosphate isomerase [Pseudoclavibacter soli]|uniref:ribose-5-phosphate isomerase n=1 Tax=Pseudoclavibacter soli TaxID=452623 RepID=UPI0004232487|nr:ribose-5-phosphate isomerase [Pseudoclavibacter soli]